MVHYWIQKYAKINPNINQQNISLGTTAPLNTTNSNTSLSSQSGQSNVGANPVKKDLIKSATVNSASSGIIPSKSDSGSANVVKTTAMIKTETYAYCKK